MCSHNNNILCNCDIEVESNFLLESLAACEGPEAKADLEMHFTVNLAFVNYFEDMIEELGKQISLKWMTQQQILPISLETFEISPNLINSLKTLRDLAVQYRNKKRSLIRKNKIQTNQKVTLNFNHF